MLRPTSAGFIKPGFFDWKASSSNKSSSAEGIDLEFDRDGIRWLVSIKSGPNWGNSSQINKMRDNFKKATRIARTGKSKLDVWMVPLTGRGW